MATSFPVSLPSHGLQRIRIRQRSIVAVGEGPYGLEQQVQRHQGQVWVMEAGLPPGSNEDLEPLVAALCSLNGRDGTFLFGPPGTTKRGAATGTPLVKGASQTGEDLITDGWTINITGIL